MAERATLSSVAFIGTPGRNTCIWTTARVVCLTARPTSPPIEADTKPAERDSSRRPILKLVSLQPAVRSRGPFTVARWPWSGSEAMHTGSSLAAARNSSAAAVVRSCFYSC